MTKRVLHKVVFLGGGGSVSEGWGIGKACAVNYAREGAKVFVVDLNEAAAQETCSIIREEGGEAAHAVADLSSADDVARVIEACAARFGTIDVLHNNVGVTRTGGAADVSLEDWDASWRINVTSMFLTTRAALPIMKAAGKGAIVNIGSVAASRYLGVPYTAYYTTKAAVLQFTRAVAIEHAPLNIRANVVSPCFIAGPNSTTFRAQHGADDQIAHITSRRAEQAPMKRMGDAFDVAHAAAFLASDEAGYITGTEIIVDGGVSAAATVPA